MKAYSRRWQEVLIVLYALHEMSGFRRKQDVLEWIEENRLINPRYLDRIGYGSCAEPKYRTLLCWGRKDSVMRGLLFNDSRDCWGITRKGREVIERLLKHGRAGELETFRCFIWSEKFRKVIDPGYVPSDRDWQQPDDYLREVMIYCQ